MFFVGNINARGSPWGDTRINTCGDILEAYIEEADALVLNNGELTFYAVNGKSFIDLTITTDKSTDLSYKQYTDTETQLLTGIPRRGHVPVFSVLKIPNSSPTHSNEIRLGKLRLKGVKNHIGRNLQRVNPEVPIYNDVYTAWDKIRDTFQELSENTLRRSL